MSNINCTTRKARFKEPIKERFERYISKEPNSGCWIWLGSMYPGGYGQFAAIRNKPNCAHRASWELYRGPIPKGLYVLHHCDIRSCVNPDHLFLGTQYDNIQDCKKKKRNNMGEKVKTSKLTAQMILSIRTDLRTQQVIANDYGVTQTCISKIKLNYRWKHLL